MEKIIRVGFADGSHLHCIPDRPSMALIMGYAGVEDARSALGYAADVLGDLSNKQSVVYPMPNGDVTFENVQPRVAQPSWLERSGVLGLGNFIVDHLLSFVLVSIACAALVLASSMAYDAEDYAETNLIFARTAGQDVIRQSKGWSIGWAAADIHNQLNWLLNSQATSTRHSIAAQPW